MGAGRSPLIRGPAAGNCATEDSRRGPAAGILATEDSRRGRAAGTSAGATEDSRLRGSAAEDALDLSAASGGAGTGATLGVVLRADASAA